MQPVKLPNLRYEKILWEKGYRFIGGVDEVGRGSFAGPVVAGCVVFSRQFSKIQIPEDIVINDSKKLSTRNRNKSSKWIKENSLSFGIGSSSVFEINRIGIAKATKTAFRRAIYSANKRLGKRIQYLLIDAFYIPYVRGLRIPAKKSRKIKNINHKSSQQTAIINGDQKVLSIACASIIAKVFRDEFMKNLGEKKDYKKYGWDKNKGYGTKEHIKAIKEYGITRLHRKQFVKNYL